MPEEGENMPSPEVPQGEPAKKEGSVAEWSFREVLKRERRLERDHQRAESEDRKEDLVGIEKEFGELDLRKKELLSDLEETGELEDLDARLGLLEDMLKEGELKREHILDGLDFARDLTKEEREKDPEDPHLGAREWYYRERLNLLREGLEKKAPPPSPMAEAAEKMIEAVESQRRAAERAIELQTLELRLPPEKDAQLKEVRRLLERIEDSNTDCRGTAEIHARVQRLETNLDEMDESVAREVRTRLALHDCSELIKQANGWIVRKTEEVGPGYSIGSAITEATRTRNHELTRDMISLLLKKGLPGLNVPRAWDLLQEVNFDYETKLAEINMPLAIEERKTPPNFYTDTKTERRQAVYEHLVKMLKREGGISQAAADRSLRLAEKLAIATLETSVFNRASEVGNDQLAEIIHLKDWRKKRKEAGRNRGPRIHEEYIEGFGSSWLRQVGKEDTTSPLRAEKVAVEDIKEGNYSYWGTVLVLRYHLLKNLLMERQPKPKSIDKDALQGAVAYFNTADPPPKGREDICGPLCLRVWWLAGVVDVALAKEELEWDADAFNDLKRAAVLEELSPEAGSFIDREQWDWIVRETRLGPRVAKLGARRGIKGVFQKLVK